MSILVVGGAGYIGSLAARRLKGKGRKVVILDNLSTGNRKAVDEGIPFYEGDILNPAILDSIFKSEKIESVMHFAAKLNVGESVEKPGIYYKNNVSGTISLLEAMLKNNCKKLIFSSTAATFGVPEHLPIGEDHLQKPINPYGKTKLLIENALVDYETAYGLKSVVFRYFNAAGASLDGLSGETAEKNNLIPIALSNIKTGLTTKVFGGNWNTPDGTCVRDYVHVEDIVSAHIMGLEFLDKNQKTDFFNLGSEHGTSVLEIIKELSKVSGKDVPYIISDRRPGDPERLVASNKKARNILGWEPVNSTIENIIKTAYEWDKNRKY